VKGVLCLRSHQDLDALVVRVDLERREEMIAADPETYFITDHYLNYPWILVRLARDRSDALPDLLGGRRGRASGGGFRGHFRGVGVVPFRTYRVGAAG
jgi:hypothetical protein